MSGFIRFVLQKCDEPGVSIASRGPYCFTKRIAGFAASEASDSGGASTTDEVKTTRCFAGMFVATQSNRTFRKIPKLWAKDLKRKIDRASLVVYPAHANIRLFPAH